MLILRHAHCSHRIMAFSNSLFYMLKYISDHRQTNVTEKKEICVLAVHVL